MESASYFQLNRHTSSGIKMRPFQRNRYFYVMLAVLATGLVIILLNMYELHSMKWEHELHHQELKKLPEIEAMSADQKQQPSSSNKPVVWIQSGATSRNDHQGRYTYLKHVHVVFERMGFRVGEQMSDWTVMWGHDYPFVTYEMTMKNLKPFQRVNHFPGSGYITNKVTLAQTNLGFIPKAFEMPSKKREFLEYSNKHPDMKWVQKSNRHRGIEIKDKDSLDLSKDGSFIQRYISNPFLIDGYKFDIGIYAIITGIDPLRVYIIEGDALFRFCPKKYYPFDDSVLEKYVVGDNYLPMWQVPSLKATWSKDFTFLHTFNEYLRRDDLDPNAVWNKMRDAIKKVVLAKEKGLISSVRNYRSKRNFFEMVRFDFVLDDQLNVFLMEANMSPNLSSDHFAQNSRLYEHVMFNVLNLVGLNHFISHASSDYFAYYDDSILVSPHDIRVFPDFCENEVCLGSCKRIQCKLCKKCLTKSLETDIKIAYLEHIERGTARRVFPPAVTQLTAQGWQPDSPMFDGLNEKNQLIYLWFIGKCRLDPAWCY